MAGEISKYLFWLGVLVALIIAITPFVTGLQAYIGWLVLIQLIIGILIGYFNITTKETNEFFLGSLAFLLSYPVFVQVTTGIRILSGLWTFIDSFLGGMAAMIAPAAVLVALKVLPSVMKD